ncbi:Panacea domain-containing protein [Brevibacillus centrosporus]|uniref:Panacea domain-containing protein n=1 Tax=Brevibacillus centrosporus TaxID=54910 RepID=UPI003B014592
MPRTTVHKVADAFLTLESMSHKKLQKLCYYAYSWYLTLYGDNLFRNNFEAWVHGPVDTQLYRDYKSFGWQEIPEKLEHGLEEVLYEFVVEVYESYGHLDADELERLTHTEAPWLVARGGIPEFVPCNSPIRDEIIRQFYSRVAEDAQTE